MIRRSPTLIAMNDSDVQQVRDAVKRKTETLLAARTMTVLQAQPPYVAAEDAKRRREALGRDERLGLR
ncbi:hypothetical protein OBBRIDRAFT_788587 [Obba rivulosa]|uniref:Uncharacterized protein n=1 Tax=Obba rivulosa TaxID=1052685 RepID=A0A8E2J7F1_9APHY|nr:hypothetical protein OBBRIDRAFT_788587 [Obba rivulosa]